MTDSQLSISIMSPYENFSISSDCRCMRPSTTNIFYIRRKIANSHWIIHSLLIQPYISREGKLQVSGSSVVAVDSVGAGEGECVLFTQGSSARLTPATKDAPVDAVIVGIVDTIEVGGAAVAKP